MADFDIFVNTSKRL